MKALLLIATVLATALLPARADTDSGSAVAPPEQRFLAANALAVSVKMNAPYAEPTDLQMICVFKHRPGGDRYLEAMQTFDERLGGLVSALRNRGEFVGELGETLLFDVPAGSLTPRRVLLIGLGEESQLSLDTLRIVGRIALREAVRLKTAHVAWAPTIRDQGNSRLDVGDGDRAAAEAVVLAYDTERRLQAQGLAEPFAIESFVIQAGPKFFERAAQQVGLGVAAVTAAVESRRPEPYRRAAPP